MGQINAASQLQLNFLDELGVFRDTEEQPTQIPQRSGWLNPTDKLSSHWT